MTLFHSPSVQSPAAYSNQNLSGNQLAARMAGAANAAQRGNLVTAIQDGGYRYKIHPSESGAGYTDADLTFGHDPGDLRRYGAAPASDITTALTKAANVSQQASAPAIYIPSELGTSCTVTAGVTFNTRPVTIIGDNYSNSVISTASDVTVFNFTLASSGSVLRDLQLVCTKVSPTPTLPAIIFTNSNFNQIQRLYVHGFGIGVQFLNGANSSYLNCIRDSQIVQNHSINIDAHAFTNALQLFNVTCGGGNTATGVKVVDSSNLLISGFDIEGCTVVGIDLDNPSVGNLGGHVIQGGDIEGGTGTFSGGAIRVGISNVHTVIGVHISGVNSAGGGTDDSFLNLINSAAVKVENVFINSGFAGAGLIDGWLRIGAAATNGVTIENVANLSLSFNNARIQHAGILCDSHSPLTGAAVATANGGLINTANIVVSRVSPAANLTGVVLQAGVRPGQRVVVLNESTFTITFDVAGTSHVADGNSDQIAANTAREYVWSAVTGLWYRKG